MFISKEEVQSMLGYTIDAPLLAKAQTMIEAYVGRVEAEVEDATDLSLLGHATAFQAVYMQSNPEVVLEQAGAAYVSTLGTSYTFTPESFAPFIAPWAGRACKRLSWMRSRSVHTGPSKNTRGKGWAYYWERY